MKEFLIENPPTIPISNKCCYYAKKKVKVDYISENNIDLSVTGLRRAEGGVRSTAHKGCFTEKEYDTDEFRPIWWYTDSDKRDYEKTFELKHSDCYEKYGLKRTGCAGCPFSRDFEKELEVLEQYEPKLYKAVQHIFGESYAYTRAFKLFKENIKRQEKFTAPQVPADFSNRLKTQENYNLENQLSIFA